MGESDNQRARNAKAQVRSILPSGVQVAGIGICLSHGRPAVKVNLGVAPDAGMQLPGDIDGVPIVYEVVGRVGKQSAG
jgi:hypothetical protein